MELKEFQMGIDESDFQMEEIDDTFVEDFDLSNFN